MRKIILVSLLAMFSLIATAQNSRGHARHNEPAATRYSLNFASQHGEAFSVFIDGDLQNRMPQTRVMVNDVSNQTHEVVVVIKRPAEKAAVLSLRPTERNVTITVNYDERHETLSLYTPAANRASYYDEDRTHRQPPRTDQAQTSQNQIVEQTIIINNNQPDLPPAPPIPQQIGVSEDEVSLMVMRMKNQSFDDDRVALGKTMVAASQLRASQIARLAQTIDFSNSQVDFLKYAYHYCIDPVNYHVVVDILTFSTDKKKVLDYIATQR